MPQWYAANMSNAQPASDQAALHEQWLLEITAIPTAAGREHRVADWIRTWTNARPHLQLIPDPHGNLTIQRKDATTARQPLYITAHLDHPAFVIESIADNTLNLTFRGGVLDPYFNNAPIVLYTQADQPVRATITATTPPAKGLDAPNWLRTATAEIKDTQLAAELAPGDIGRWDLPDPEITNDSGKRLVYTHACDDLAAVAAALAAYDTISKNDNAQHVRILFTLAEEVGFVGAIAACQSHTMPTGSSAILLENSRSFDDSPIGGGPIIRVGDRASTFSHTLTSMMTTSAEALEKALKDDPLPFKWQRKLMPGGVCEAACYQAFGYDASCLCFPLGNYHNMADLQAVQDEDQDAIANARAGREHISMSDYHNLIRLLIEIATNAPEAPAARDTMDKLYAQRATILTQPTGHTTQP